MNNVTIKTYGNFVNFIFEGYKVSAQVFSEPSEYGINGSQLSRLTVKQYNFPKWEAIVNYERGHYFEPKLDNPTLEKIISKAILESKTNGQQCC